MFNGDHEFVARRRKIADYFAQFSLLCDPEQLYSVAEPVRALQILTRFGEGKRRNSMKRSIALATAAVVGLTALAETGTAAVILEGSAPTTATSIYNSYPSTAPLDVSQSSDYFTLGTFRNGDATAAGMRPTGSAFGASLVPVGGTTVRLAGSGQGPTVTPAHFPTGWVFNQGESKVGSDGISLTYTLAANTTATLNYYIGSLNASYEYFLTAAGQGTPLASLSTPTIMTGGTTAGTNTFNAGVLSFEVTNEDSTPSLLTFSLLYGGPTGTFPGVGIQAATAAVPEPATLGLVGLGAVTLLRRRRAARA